MISILLLIQLRSGDLGLKQETAWKPKETDASQAPAPTKSHQELVKGQSIKLVLKFKMIFRR